MRRVAAAAVAGMALGSALLLGRRRSGGLAAPLRESQAESMERQLLEREQFLERQRERIGAIGGKLQTVADDGPWPSYEGMLEDLETVFDNLPAPRITESEWANDDPGDELIDRKARWEALDELDDKHFSRALRRAAKSRDKSVAKLMSLRDALNEAIRDVRRV